MNKIITLIIFSILVSYSAQSQINVDCSVGPVNTNFCYDSGVLEEYIYVSNDGNSLNLTVNSGIVEQGWDEFIVLDTDGTELYNGYGNGGDLSGLTFLSTGDSITVQVTPDGSIDCQGSGSINPIDLTVSCATCTNPQVDFELVDDCLNAPQFFVEADILDLGSATDLDITDNQGNPVQTVSNTGIVSFGPYPNGTSVELTVSNNQDVNCIITSSIFSQDNCTSNLVDCTEGPVNTNFCYDSGVLEEYIYVSNDGNSLNLTVNSGNVEQGWDEFIVLDTDGTELYNGYGNGGDLSGLFFQSSGDTITVQVTPDGSIDCQGSGSIDPIDLSVSCATCINPQVDFELVDDCLNAPQFFVEANVLDLGSATDLDVTDNQGSPAQTVSATGVLSFGPYPNGTLVELTVSNNQDANCQITSSGFTQDACTTNVVDCTLGPVNTNFCYDSGVQEEFTYISSDGSSLNLTVNSGNVENNFDEFIVIDSDGTELFNGYGNNGDLSGLTFQSSGDTITVQLTPDISVDCQGSGTINPIDLSVSCATCTNPQVNFELVDDCINAPQFFVEATITDLGSATDLDITDNQGSAAQTVSSTGLVSFGPYPNGTIVELTVSNNQDVNCQVISSEFTQDICTTTLVDCTAGPVDINFCYDSGVNEEFIFVSNDGTPLNLVVNSGSVESFFDEFIVLDTDGTELFNGYGNGGDLSGLDFQSSGDTITVQVTPDGSIDCQGSGNIDPIDITVSCATCINPEVEYFLVGDCENGNEEFNVEVDVIDIGSATSLDITNNQGDPLQNVSVPTTLSFGPYPLGTEVIFTVENIDDPNCTLTSPSQTLMSCGCFGADPFCAPAPGEALIFENVSDGTPAPEGIDYDCLFTQPNPTWFFLQIEDAGDLDFEIVQNTQFDANGNPVGQPLDVDFIAWGPFTNTQDACNDLSQNTQVGCSYSAAPVENFSITNAQSGEIYIVLITNFNGSPGFISLGQTNSESPGSGSTDCDIVLQNQVVGCEGEDITLTATDTTADQYQWLVFDETLQDFDPILGEDQVSTTVSDSGLYQVLTLNGSEVSTEEFDVTLTPQPEHNLPQEISLCGSTQVTLDASVLNDSEYDIIEHEWLFEGNSISGAPGDTHNATQPGNYSVIITTTNLNTDTDGNDLVCTNQYDVQVSLSDFSVDLGDSLNFCSTQLETITATVNGADATNATYQWSNGENTPSIQVDTSGTYEVTVTIDGCPVTESVVYTFAEEPQFDLGADLNLCEDQTSTLDASVANASAFTSVSYQWSDDSGILNGETNPTLTVGSEGNYSVAVTTTTSTPEGTDFECSTTASVFVNVTDFSVDLGDNQQLCDAEPQTITASINVDDPSNATYLWNTGESSQSITVSESGIYEVTVTIDNCPVMASVEYIFNESPIIALGPDSQTCDLTEFTLDATPSNFNQENVTYVWTLDGTDLNQNTALLNPNDFGFGTYQVNVFFDDPNCSTTDDITISLRDDISVAITSNDVDNLFCIDETVTFNASLQNAEQIEADFQWFVNDEPEGDNSPTLTNYEITSSETDQDVRVEVTIGSECFVSDQLSFNLYDVDNCVISQGLSPNDDGDNDNLDLRFLDDRSGIVSFELFNRYGQKVYEKANYRDEFIGQSDNGNMLETGTYFYVIKFENEDDIYGQVHKGWIYINREQ